MQGRLQPVGEKNIMYIVPRDALMACRGVSAGRPPQLVVEAKLPKALLQQHCQRQGWPPPRFERCAAGGLRLPGAGIRYSVTLVRPHACWKEN